MWKIPPGGACSGLQIETVGVTRDIAGIGSPLTTQSVWVTPALLFLTLSLIIMIILEALILVYDRGGKKRGNFANILLLLFGSSANLCVFTLFNTFYTYLKGLFFAFFVLIFGGKKWLVVKFTLFPCLWYNGQGHPWKEVVKTLTCNPFWFPRTDWCTCRVKCNPEPQRTQGESSQEWRRCRRREQWRSSWCRCKRLQERLWSDVGPLSTLIALMTLSP